MCTTTATCVNDQHEVTAPSVDIITHEETNESIAAAPADEPVEVPETPKKKKLKRVIANLRTKLWRATKIKKTPQEFRIGQILSGLAKLLPLETMDFIRTQVKMTSRSKNGRRWSTKDKMLALSIFYQSQKTYLLLKKLFCLPAPSTLQKTLQKTRLYPGFNPRIMHAMSLKVQHMDDDERDCALIFDEMAIKEFLQHNPDGDFVEGFESLGDGPSPTTNKPADHASVFMVRGLKSKWKQPLGYFLTSGTVPGSTLQTLTHHCISEIKKTGLRVRVFICDQGSNNRQFLDREDVSPAKPYITHSDDKIYVMYDPCHLLKNVRNNMKKHGYVWQDQHIKWEYIESFFQIDQRSSVKMAPKLTEKHIALPPFKTMRVNLAAQVLSHSVAAGINVLAQLEKLPKEASSTAIFIDNFDKLFNCFNSKTSASSQPMGHALGEDSGHKTFLQDQLTFLSEIRLATGKKTPPCFNGWQISINALLGLWEELKLNFKFLLTNRLNQDCVENLFSIIRGRGGHRDNPTAMQFRSAFRHIVVEKLFIQSNNSNCAVDFDSILLDLSCLTAAPVADTQADDPDNGSSSWIIQQTPNSSQIDP